MYTYMHTYIHKYMYIYRAGDGPQDAWLRGRGVDSAALSPALAVFCFHMNFWLASAYSSTYETQALQQTVSRPRRRCQTVPI